MYDGLLFEQLKRAQVLRAAAFARYGIDPLFLAQLSREHRRLSSSLTPLGPEDMRAYRVVMNQIENEEPRVRQALADLFVGPLGSIRVTGVSGLSDGQRVAVADAVTFLSTITAMSVTVHAIAPPGRTREAYDPATCSLILSSAGSPAPVIVHELGHALEHQAATPAQIGLRQSFYAKRTLSEVAVPLVTVTGNPAYHPTEHTKVDQWLHPYIGKLYPDVRASEVVSMGLQLLYSDPVLLADDLEHLDFMYAFLRGTYE